MDRHFHNLARAFRGVNPRLATHQAWRLTQAVLLALVLTVALLSPAAALADAPGTRGEDDPPQGSTSGMPGGELTAGGVPLDAGTAWQHVEQLPPFAAAPEAKRLHLQPAYSDGEPGAVLPWLSRPLNPGNWILDAGMGIFTGITATIGEMLQQSVMSLVGSGEAATSSGQWSVIPSSCGDGAVQNFVFCTPASMTYRHPGVRNVWGVLRAIATGLVTVLFIVRIGRMLADGPRALAAEGKPLIVTFVFVMLFVQGTEYTCGFLIDLFNAISESILANASFSFPAVSDTPFAIGARIMGAFFWMLMLMLTLKSLFRVVAIAVLVGVAPLAGAMLMDRATSSRFRSWLEKLIELLLEQVALIIVFTVATAMLVPIQGASGGDQIAQFLMGSVTMVMALFGPSAMIGIASGASSGYLASMLQMRMISGVQRAATAGVRAGGRAVVAGGLAAAGAITTRGGDPALSAAARRMAETVALRTGKDDRGAARRDHLAFRMPQAEAGKGGSPSAALTRYERAGQVGGEHAARQRAAIRARAMDAQADGLSAAGQRAAADRMRGRAGLQRAFAHGEDISRTPRFGTGRRDIETGRMAVSPRGQERRAVYAHALEETKARHLAEQRALKTSIAADQQLLAGDAQPGMEQARRDAAERVRKSQARFASLTQTRDAGGHRMSVAPVTRAEASTLARERWAKREVARPSRPSIALQRTPEQAVAGVRPTPRRIQPTHALHRASFQRPQVRGQHPGPQALPVARRAGFKVRASEVAAHHQQRATDAFKAMRDLQRQATAAEPTDPALATRLRREAGEASRAGRRHEALRARTAAIAGSSTWAPPASGRTPDELTRRRAAFTAIRAEVRAQAEREGVLPETADADGERLRRAELMRESVRSLARERLGDLADPSQRRRS